MSLRTDFKPGERLAADFVNDVAEHINSLSQEVIAARAQTKSDPLQFPCSLVSDGSTQVLDNYSVMAIHHTASNSTNSRTLKMIRPKKDQYDKLLFTNQNGQLAPGVTCSGYVTPIVPGGFYELRTETGVVVGDVTGPATDKYTIGKPADAIVKPLLCVSAIRDGRAFYVGIGSASANCSNKWQLFFLWNPTQGQAKLRVRARETSASAWVPLDIVIPYNATTTQVKDAIEAHSLINENTVTVTGSGALPINNFTITMPTNTMLGDGSVSLFNDSSNPLKNDNWVTPSLALWSCCT